MNYKNTLFLSCAFVSSCGVMAAMTPSDHIVLDKIQNIAHTQSDDGAGSNRDIWEGYLPDNTKIIVVKFLTGPFQGRIILTKPVYLRDSFATDSSVQEALSYLTQKYETQSPSYRVTQ